MDVLDALLDPWRSGIGQRALAEAVLVAAICGAIGFWVVSYELSYGAESLTHGMLPGLVIAALAALALLLGALGGLAAAAALIGLAARDERIDADAATAVVVTGMLGLGALLALAPDAPPRLEELLFGDPLAATVGDVATAAALVVTGGVALAALHRPLSAVAFDPAGAGALGLRPTAVRIGLLLLLAAALSVAVEGLGNLLALAVLVAPAAAVQRHARNPARAVALASAIAVAASVAGLYASHYLEIAAGAAIALALCAAAALGTLVPRRVQEA
ncbi:MAG: metal ABC transporter permease [Thermoleophilaceae bacterium]